MPKSLIKWGFRVIGWALAATGAAALLITALVAMPLAQPPMLASISETSRAIDRSTMPGLEHFQARDGTTLVYRHYSARASSGGRIAILVHGSSGSSTSVHALADALAEHGVETYAVDIRGHGASGTRGDIAYLGQLEDDLQDLVAVVRQKSPNAPLTLIGHFRRRRFRVARGRFAAAAPVRAHRAAGALSRSVRPDQPAEFRWLGQS
jgi:hypothetical protein